MPSALTEDAAGAADRTGQLRRETGHHERARGHLALRCRRAGARGRGAARVHGRAARGRVAGAARRRRRCSLLQVEDTPTIRSRSRSATRSPTGRSSSPTPTARTPTPRRQPRAVGAILGRAAELMGVSARRLAAERVAPPRLAPLTEGMVDAVKPAVAVGADRPARATGPARSPRAPAAPAGAVCARAPRRRFADPRPTSVDEDAAAVPRAAPPSLARVVTPGGARLGASPPRWRRRWRARWPPRTAAPRPAPPAPASRGAPGLRASEAVAASLERARGGARRRRAGGAHPGRLSRSGTSPTRRSTPTTRGRSSP